MKAKASGKREAIIGVGFWLVFWLYSALAYSGPV